MGITSFTGSDPLNRSGHPFFERLHEDHFRPHIHSVACQAGLMKSGSLGGYCRSEHLQSNPNSFYPRLMAEENAALATSNHDSLLRMQLACRRFGIGRVGGPLTDRSNRSHVWG